MIDWKIELNKILKTTWPEPDPFRQISSRGIALYGAGEMGEMAIDLLSIVSIFPEYVVDKNKIGFLKGIKIIRPDNIPIDDKEKLTFVVCVVSSPFTPIKDLLSNLGCKDIRHFYDITEIIPEMHMSNGWVIKNPDEEQIDGIEKVCKTLEHDQRSLAHYLQFLWWRLRRKEVISPKYPVLSDRKYFKAPCFPRLDDHQRFLDGGSHHGQNVREFIDFVENKFDHIWAFEPDSQNRNILRNIVNTYPEEITSRISINSEALSNKSCILRFRDGLNYASRLDPEGELSVQATSIDELDINPTIIRLHIEGGELQALRGAINTIIKYRPILMVLSDHCFDGLYKIANYISSLNIYKVFFCLHDYCGNTAVYYAYTSDKSRE